jgi:hypothetical protein
VVNKIKRKDAGTSGRLRQACTFEVHLPNKYISNCMKTAANRFVEQFKREFDFLFESTIVKETCFDGNTIFGILTSIEFETPSYLGYIRIYDTGLYLIDLVDRLTYSKVFNLAWLRVDDELEGNRKRDFQLLKEKLMVNK